MTIGYTIDKISIPNVYFVGLRCCVLNILDIDGYFF